MSSLNKVRKNRTPKRILFDRVWSKMSIYVRQKAKGKCYTCGDKRDYKSQNAGHFLHGKTKPTYLNEDNVRCQCVKCNKWLSGNLGIFGVKLVKEIGDKRVNKLIKQKDQIKIWKIEELEKLDKYYTNKLKEL